MEKKKLFETLNNMGTKTKCIILTVASVVLLGVVILVIFSPEGGTTFSAETSLKEVLEISDLATAEYTYNSIAEVKNDKETKYHVSYKGTVKAGFDFKDIEMIEQEDKILVILPEIEILSVVVNTDMEYIFTKSKYDTESTYAEAYNACIEDLNKKASENQTLRKTAEESAVEMVKALLKPFENQLSEGQVFEVMFTNNDTQEEAQ